MFESKDDLKLLNKLLKDKLNIANINFNAAERARARLTKERDDALKTATDAKSNAEDCARIRKVLDDKLDESSIIEGRILRIEQSPAESPYGPAGILLTVRIPQPWHPSYMWGGGPTDGNGKTISISDPSNANHPKIKPILDKYRKEMNEYHAFHVGAVYLKMPALEKE